MALDAALPAARTRTLPFARGLTARVGLTLVVLASFLARAVSSAAHPAPRYFPDEYLYTAIARALGSGHAPSVRGDGAHFPALLAPLLAAPFHALSSPETAYRLTQAENALLMSLAAIPVYLLARRLSLGAGYALGCAVFAVAIPDLVFASYTMADPVAYPFALGAVAAGVAALERPTRRAHALFAALAFLATFARIQYVVLFAAFAIGTVLLRRRRLRLVLAVATLAAAGATQVLGYYANVVHLHVGGGLVRWAAADLYLLALASGVVLVPGALVTLARVRTPFAAFATPFASGLVLEAALYASNGSARFQERYLFAALPLLPLAFGVWLRSGRPHLRVAALVAAALLAAAARVPLAGYAAGLGRTDSPFLSAVHRLEQSVGTGNASLAAALLVTLLAGAALAARRSALPLAIGLALLLSLGAAANDRSTAQGVRNELVAPHPSWVDAMHPGPVTLVQTEGAPPAGATEQLYWNRSITREVLLGDALATDVYAAPRIRAAADGTLRGVSGSFLFHAYAATARFENAHVVRRAGAFELWASEETPRLSLLEQGRYADGRLAPAGRLTLWPDASGRTRGTLRFALSSDSPRPVTVRFGKARYVVTPGLTTTVSYTIDKRGALTLPFSTTGSVRSTAPELRRAAGPSYMQSLSA